MLADIHDLLRERLPEPEGVKTEPAPADDLPGEPVDHCPHSTYDRGDGRRGGSLGSCGTSDESEREAGEPDAER